MRNPFTRITEALKYTFLHSSPTPVPPRIVGPEDLLERLCLFMESLTPVERIFLFKKFDLTLQQEVTLLLAESRAARGGQDALPYKMPSREVEEALEAVRRSQVAKNVENQKLREELKQGREQLERDREDLRGREEQVHKREAQVMAEGFPSDWREIVEKEMAGRAASGDT